MVSEQVPVGRVLDGLVAAQVMGWRNVHNKAATAQPFSNGNSWWGDPPTASEHGGHVPYYSTDMAAAWEIIEHLRDQWTAATAHCSATHPDFDPPFRDDVFFDKLHRAADRRWPWALLYLTPEAICRAALAAFTPPEDDADAE